MGALTECLSSREGRMPTNHEMRTNSTGREAGSYHAQQGLYTQKIGASQSQLRKDRHGVLEVQPRLFAVLLRLQAIREPEFICQTNDHVDASPSSGIITGLLRILPLYHFHEGAFMINGEQPVSRSEEVLD